jgi:hypothetical protein
MTRYAIIDENSGFVYGIEDADDPIAACDAMGRKLGEYDSAYEDIGCARFDGRSGYHVYEAPADYQCRDGQDDAEIALVQSMPLAARIVSIWTDPTEAA